MSTLETDKFNQPSHNPSAFYEGDGQHGSGPYHGFGDRRVLEEHRDKNKNWQNSPSGPWGEQCIGLRTSTPSGQSDGDRLVTLKPNRPPSTGQ